MHATLVVALCLGEMFGTKRNVAMTTQAKSGLLLAHLCTDVTVHDGPHSRIKVGIP